MNITRYSRALLKLSRTTLPRMSQRLSPKVLNFHINQKNVSHRNFCSSVFSKSPDYEQGNDLIDSAKFEPLCAQTLEALTDYFEEIVEADDKLVNGDVAYSDGVLTVKLGGEHGTYVINRQTPNRQIWLSSPTSGPKRYDLIDGNWIYKHDGMSLYQLLQNELEKIMSNPVDFLNLTNKKN